MVDKADIVTRMRVCFKSVFPNLSDEQVATATRENIRTWDSQMTLTIVMLVEEEFNLWIGERAASEIKSFDDAVRMTSEKL